MNVLWMMSVAMTKYRAQTGWNCASRIRYRSSPQKAKNLKLSIWIRYVNFQASRYQMRRQTTCHSIIWLTANKQWNRIRKIQREHLFGNIMSRIALSHLRPNRLILVKIWVARQLLKNLNRKNSCKISSAVVSDDVLMPWSKSMMNCRHTRMKIG